MEIRHARSQLIPSSAKGQPIPGLAKAGALVIAIGLLNDLVEHTFVSHVHEAVVGSFPVGEHAAHLIVVAGMALVLVGIVADGIRSQRRSSR